MNHDNPRTRFLVGGSWLIAARMFDRLVGIVSITILARLLTPADFGVVAVAGTVVSAVELFSAFGFDWALVRRRDLTADDLNSAWTLRLIFGLCTFAVLAAMSPAAAAFYHQPAMQRVIVAMGAIAFIGAWENIGTVFFRREFAFHKEFLLRSAAKLSGFVVTVSLAFHYRSYWALVAGLAAIRCTFVVASYIFHPFRPSLSLKASRELFGFSSWLLLGNVIEYCRERFADIYLGRVFGSSATGLFAVAGEISIVPITEVASPINRVAYSQYAEDVRANRGLAPSYLRIASLIWLVSLPIAVGTIAIAPEGVALLLGPKWKSADVVLEWLALGTIFTVVTANTHYVYWALGHSRLVAWLGIVGIVFVVPLTVWLGAVAGYVGVASAYAFGSALVVPVNFAILRRISGIRFLDLWLRVWRIVVGVTVMFLTLHFLFPQWSGGSNAEALLILIEKAIVGALVYVAITVGAWIICGKPSGPEEAALQLTRESLEKCRSLVL